MTSSITEPALDRPDLFVDGEWTSPTGGATTDVVEAATEQVLGTAASATRPTSTSPSPRRDGPCPHGEHCAPKPAPTSSTPSRRS